MPLVGCLGGRVQAVRPGDCILEAETKHMVATLGYSQHVLGLRTVKAAAFGVNSQ